MFMLLLMCLLYQKPSVLKLISLCLIIPGRHGKYIFTQEKFYLQGFLNDINEQDTGFLDYKQKHVMKRGAPPDKVGVLPRVLPKEFHGFTSRKNSKGYRSLVPGLISISLETVWLPLICWISFPVLVRRLQFFLFGIN